MGRILRLEVNNFKSYGGKQEIGPFARFTAVVGPNGSGKSNLMDAISFVLGVQSRQLRSNQLKDLLHKSGLAPTIPEGGAYVSLIYELDDDEKKRLHGKHSGESTSSRELTFTRCISEKGVGSYHINHQDKSYEEYESALKDLGILVKARNFLVFQGDVESIASKSPDQLTRMFELISSSEELKDEYEKCLQEKAVAEENTIFAYQKRKGLAAERKIVKEQKEEAERFKQRRNELAKTKQEYYLWQVRHLDVDASAHKHAIAQLSDKLATFQAKQQDIAALQKDQKKAHATQLKTCRHLDALAADVARELEDVAPRTIQLNEQIKHAKKKLDAASTNEKAMARNVDNHAREVQGLTADVQDLKQAQAELDASKDDQELVLEGAQVDEFNRIKNEAKVKTLQLRNTLGSLQMHHKADTGRLQALVRDEKEHSDELARMNEDHASAVARLVDIRRVVANSTSEIQDTEAELSNAEQFEKALADKKLAVKAELDQIHVKLRHVKDGMRQSKADQRKADTLETLTRLFPGVRGRLVDLCKPIQRKYNMAVTVATGKHMDALVVSDYKTAGDCIQYLREQRLESVEFIPLDRIRVTPPNERFRRLGDNIKLVVDVIACDADIQPAVAYAVSDSIVCESIDDARDVCFRRNEKVKAVTLNGMVVSKNGSMTGGKTHKDAARSERWDEKETAALKAQREQLHAQLASLDKESTGVVRKQTLETKLGSLTNRLRYANADIKTTESKLPKILARQTECQKVLQQIAPEIQTLRGAIAARESSMARLEVEINMVEDSLFEGFSHQFGIASIREYEENVVKQRQERSDRRQQLDSHLAKVQAQLQYLQAQDLPSDWAKLKDNIAKQKRALKALEKEKTDLQTQTAALEVTSERHVEASTAAHDTLKRIEGELKAISKQRDDQSAKAASVQKQLAVEETAVERFKDKKGEVLKRATMDQVKLPVVGDAVGSDDEDVDMSGESISLTNQADTRYAANEIDFSSLEQLHLDSDKARQDHLLKYEQTIAAIAGDLERMQPNMKALDKYDEIQARISHEEEELEKIKVRWLNIY
ncbi:hypothetical protein, variant 2 [Aphanomyces astaci]|uniref:SMC hinge domain-containing protein n=1 Tax=Aphanomyces astaci TaxID=112090 RepID=W4H7R5_APHAT|nr:hypothetical protein, variant 2 [Aphanomyces astaci]ETV87596.1 hypothetical protein, variant 2 [Aphanomyces astaci]|eukprot:XP_009822459.1 hypothetical protein, variant 2 [Aphanomyces astaci]